MLKNIYKYRKLLKRNKILIVVCVLTVTGCDNIPQHTIYQQKKQEGSLSNLINIKD